MRYALKKTMFEKWVISIIGIIIITVLAEIIIPDGKTNKLIKFILTFVFAVVLISPLKNIKSLDFSAFSLSEEGIMPMDENLLNYIKDSKTRALERSLVSALEEKGVAGAEASIVSGYTEYELTIENVTVNLKKYVINGGSMNINIINTVKQTAESTLNIPTDKVVIIYE